MVRQQGAKCERQEPRQDFEPLELLENSQKSSRAPRATCTFVFSTLRIVGQVS